jgi:4-hydroxybenzoate polyprenyltransferase
MFEALIGALGLAAAALYAGYLAYAIGSPPLWVIVAAAFALAIRQFVVDLRSGARAGRPMS